jgi:hypothetical protein
VLILLSISFGVGYLFLPLSFFVKEALICKIKDRKLLIYKH